MSETFGNKSQLIEILNNMADKINMSRGGGVILSGAVQSITPRWLRFDPTNKKGLVIKAGTLIKKANGAYQIYNADTHIDLTSSVTEAGKDYFVNLANDGTIIANTNKLASGVTIGRFHTLCVSVGTPTMIAPASPNSGLTTANKFLIKGYDEDTDPDFYAFYNKQITAVSADADHYDVVTTAHPLSGFVAGDILPESVFCLTFRPGTLYEDAMVYDKDTDRMIDVYLQSGTANNTRSRYNATHTVNRTAYNHAEDLRAVGKRPLRDCEFTSAALGSNECTNIIGSEDKTTVGGHVDTANRRMISAIGVEEACGYLWQWLDDKTGNIDTDTQAHWVTTDGRGSFGQEWWQPYVLLAGGAWITAAGCGSRSRSANNVRSTVAPILGGRGSSRVVRYTE